MVPLLANILRVILLLLIELAVFFFFYSRPEGRAAVYFSRYANIIDFLAISSGFFIIGLAVYSLSHPYIFAIAPPTWVFAILILIGSWQVAIHAVKFVIRLLSRRKQ